MKIFTLDNTFQVVCEWKKTRMAFKHEAAITRDGNVVHRTKICYQNRTWERYEYQSVLCKAINNLFPEAEAKKYIDKVNKKVEQESKQSFGMLAAVAKLGEILCDTPEDANKWKMRMLKAGMGEGLQPPDDFDNLPEDEKTRRLDGAIETLRA